MGANISVILSHVVCGSWLWQPQETTVVPNSQVFTVGKLSPETLNYLPGSGGRAKSIAGVCPRQPGHLAAQPPCMVTPASVHSRLQPASATPTAPVWPVEAPGCLPGPGTCRVCRKCPHPDLRSGVTAGRPVPDEHLSHLVCWVSPTPSGHQPLEALRVETASSRA